MDAALAGAQQVVTAAVERVVLAAAVAGELLVAPTAHVGATLLTNFTAWNLATVMRAWGAIRRMAAAYPA